MLSYAFFGFVACLYYACFLSLVGLTAFVACRVTRGTRPRAKLRNTFSLLALSLLSWQATVFLEVRMTLPVAQLWVGRFNFATVVVVVYLALRFVQQIPTASSSLRSSGSAWLRAETALLFVLTLFTPLVDAE